MRVRGVTCRCQTRDHAQSRGERLDVFGLGEIVDAVTAEHGDERAVWILIVQCAGSTMIGEEF